MSKNKKKTKNETSIDTRSLGTSRISSKIIQHDHESCDSEGGTDIVQVLGQLARPETQVKSRQKLGVSLSLSLSYLIVSLSARVGCRYSCKGELVLGRLQSSPVWLSLALVEVKRERSIKTDNKAAK